MTRQQQDLNWECLTKEVRDEIISNYYEVIENSTVPDMLYYCQALEDIFGEHNLTSRIDPPEMLVIPRSVVIEYYTDSKDMADKIRNEETKSICKAKMNLLENLFGYKCLPDDTNPCDVRIRSFAPGEVQSIEETYPPRDKNHGATENLDFKLGDIVYIHPDKQKLFKINRIQEETGDCELKDEKTGSRWGWISQKHLRLCDMKETVLGKMTCPNCGLDMDTTGEPCGCGYNPKTGEVEESPLLKSLREMEEEYELNLHQLLRDCVGKTFFSRSHGEVDLYRVSLESKGEYFLDFKFSGEIILRFTSDGRRTKKGEIDLWPSRELYEKYPLLPDEAWREWEGSGSMLGNQIEAFLKSCVLPDDIDDRCYMAARKGILMGLKLNTEYLEEEIRRILGE